jgi:sec-independent protein translocase protein TatC
VCVALIGLVTAGFLVRQFKYAFLAIFVIAAVVTPSPDVLSQLLVAGFMLLLYGLRQIVTQPPAASRRGGPRPDLGRLC